MTHWSASYLLLLLLDVNLTTPNFCLSYQVLIVMLKQTLYFGFDSFSKCCFLSCCRVTIWQLQNCNFIFIDGKVNNFMVFRTQWGSLQWIWYEEEKVLNSTGWKMRQNGECLVLFSCIIRVTQSLRGWIL